MEALKSIKSHPLYKIIPVVMISGTGFPGDVRESYRLGANSYIIKPFSNGHTMQTITTFLTYWLTTVELPEINAVNLN